MTFAENVRQLEIDRLYVELDQEKMTARQRLAVMEQLNIRLRWECDSLESRVDELEQKSEVLLYTAQAYFAQIVDANHAANVAQRELLEVRQVLEAENRELKSRLYDMMSPPPVITLARGA